MNVKISVAKDFSITPGARYRTDGDFSGQEFYEDILHEKFISILETEESLIVDLDGTDGYATSFLDAAFGELARKFGKEKVLAKIVFISEEEPYLIEEIKSYMNEN